MCGDLDECNGVDAWLLIVGLMSLRDDDVVVVIQGHGQGRGGMR